MMMMMMIIIIIIIQFNSFIYLRAELNSRWPIIIIIIIKH
jgi:hypothetical protein